MTDIKSQNDLNKPETHSTDVLLDTISKLETTTNKMELYKEIIKDEMIKNGERLEEIERLQKQLEIAKRAMRKIVREYFDCVLKKDIRINGYSVFKTCDKALKEIEEINK